MDVINQATDDLSFYELGNEYKEKGEYDKAIENYNKAPLKNS
jgi:tetratricopeptide (TPR) repeat protein